MCRLQQYRRIPKVANNFLVAAVFLVVMCSGSSTLSLLPRIFSISFLYVRHLFARTCPHVTHRIGIIIVRKECCVVCTYNVGIILSQIFLFFVLGLCESNTCD